MKKEIVSCKNAVGGRGSDRRTVVELSISRTGHRDVQRGVNGHHAKGEASHQRAGITPEGRRKVFLEKFPQKNQCRRRRSAPSSRCGNRLPRFLLKKENVTCKNAVDGSRPDRRMLVEIAIPRTGHQEVQRGVNVHHARSFGPRSWAAASVNLSQPTKLTVW